MENKRSVKNQQWPDCIGEKMIKHGESKPKTAEYRTWETIIQRCHNDRCVHYPRYGGRGITVCQRWRDDYVNFLEDMGRRPEGRFTIDRIDGKLGYCKENCRWATYGQQLRNTTRNRWITYSGETLCAKDWAKKLGMCYETLRCRLKAGLSIEDAFFVSTDENIRSWK